jgi:tRNA threonylcarbamoyladenosine modification (KEOPS) complex  Pcc1 subunit
MNIPKQFLQYMIVRELRTFRGSRVNLSTYRNAIQLTIKECNLASLKSIVSDY